MDALRVEGRRRGLLDIGYHLVIDRDGIGHLLRDVKCVGSHTPGYNHLSIGVCLLGGRSEITGEPEANFEKVQVDCLVRFAAGFLVEWPQGRIAAHHELRGYNAVGDAYRCPPFTNIALGTIRHEASELAASGQAAPLSVMTTKKAA